AFQTWAVNANINLGVVPDQGQPFGTTGLPQGDSRFGDIRISGLRLSPDVLAFTTPFDFTGSTWSGDVRVNTSYRFDQGGQTGIDLFTALVQEAGHAFGLDNSSDPNSVMYEYYGGARTALSAGDIANLQALYGARAPDCFE